MRTTYTAHCLLRSNTANIAIIIQAPVIKKIKGTVHLKKLNSVRIYSPKT